MKLWILTKIVNRGLFPQNPMPACPHCSRMNHENRETCLYCGGDLPRLPASDPRVALPKKVRQAGKRSFLLVLLPAKDPSGYAESILGKTVADALSNWFSTDRFHLSQWFKIRAPKILKAFEDESEATTVGQEMRKMGLQVLAVPNDQLNEYGYSFRAVQVDLGSGMIFSGKDRHKFALDPEKANFLVRGKIVVQKPHGREKAKGSVFSGQDSGFEGFSAGDTLADTTDYLVFDLFTQEGGLPPLRVKSSQFDFTCLGPLVTSSSMINFNHFIDLLKKRCPNLKVDDSFRYVSPDLTDRKTSNLFDPTVEHVSPRGNASAYHDNEPQFQEHARLMCYLHQNALL